MTAFTLEALQRNKITAYDWFLHLSPEYRELDRETRERGLWLELRNLSADGQRVLIELRVNASYAETLMGAYPRTVWDAAGGEGDAPRPIGEMSREALRWLIENPHVRCPEDWRGKRSSPWAIRARSSTDAGKP